MPTPSNKKSDFDRVWKVTDYGNVDALLKLSAGGLGGGGTSAAVGPDGRTLFPEGMPTGISTVIENGKIAATPGVKAAAQEILADPQGFVDKRMDPKAAEAQQSILDKGKTFLGELFDTSDTYEDGKYKGSDVPLESIWDGFLTAFNWTTDRISQVTVAGLSGLPGGTRTLEWDEANNVSVGQQIVANVGVSTGDLRRGEGNIGDLLALTASGPLGLVGFAAPDSATQKKGFDISSAEDRKTFDEGWERFGSGALDVAFTVLADPFIIGGKALKITRIKYIDRPLTAKNIQVMTKEIDDGASLYAAGEIDRAAPIAQLVADAVTRRADGSRMPTREAMLRAEIKWGDNAEGIADALTTLPDGSYDLAGLVVKAGLGNARAVEELSRRSLIAADTLVNAKRTQLSQSVAQDPPKYLKAMEKATLRRDRAFKTLEAQQKQFDAGNIGKDVLADAKKKFDDIADEVKALDEGFLRDGLAAPDQTMMQLSVAMVKEAEQNNEWFAKVLADSRGGEVGRMYTSAGGAYKGFASDTAVGRFVSKRRAKKARSDYERKSTSQQGVRSTDYFGANRFQRTIRVFKRMNDEVPAYYVNFAAPVDQGREVGAILDTLSIYSGAGKQVTDKAGNTVTVGGIARKDELFTMYTSARSMGETVADAMIKIQDNIRDDLADFYNFDRDIAKNLSDTAFSKQDNLKQQIQTAKDGYFMDAADGTELATLNVAPFLNTQLSNGMYVLPWDTFETILKNIDAGKLPEWQIGKLRTGKGMTADLAQNINGIFQDFWRPAVLFRLGYTQRNVTEGLFRSIAYNGTFEPLMWAGKAASQSRANFRRVKRAEREFKKLQGQIDAPDAARDKFDGLAWAQRELHDAENWLLGAKGRMTSQALQVGEKNTPPTVSFWNSDFNVAPMVSDDGAFQIVKRVAPANAAPIVATAAAPGLKWKSPKKGPFDFEADGYGIARVQTGLADGWRVVVPETRFADGEVYEEFVEQLFNTSAEAKKFASDHAKNAAKDSAPAPTAQSDVVAFNKVGAANETVEGSVPGYTITTRVGKITDGSTGNVEEFTGYVVTVPAGGRLRNTFESVSEAQDAASRHLKLGLAEDVKASASGAPPALQWKAAGQGGGRYEADGYGIERFQETTTSTATYKGVTVTEWGVSLPDGAVVPQTFKSLKDAKDYVANRAAADASQATPTSAAALGIDRSRGLMLDEQGVLTKFYSPTVFRAVEQTSAEASASLPSRVVFPKPDAIGATTKSEQGYSVTKLAGGYELTFPTGNKTRSLYSSVEAAENAASTHLKLSAKRSSKKETAVVWVSDDGVFEVTQAGKGKWLRTPKSDLAGVGSTQREFSSKAKAMSGNRAATDEEIQSLTPTPTAATAAAPSVAPATPDVTKYVVNQLDPVDNATFIPAVGGRLFDSAEDAVLAVEKAVADSFAGVRIPGPQFEKIYLMGQKAQTLKITPQKSPLGVEYADIAAIDQELARLADEGKSIADQIEAFGGRPVSGAIKSKKFQAWRDERIASKNAEIDDALAYEVFLKDLIEAGGLSVDNYAANLQLIRQIREQNETFLTSLERDDMFALTEYTSQAGARRTVDNGSKLTVTPGVVLESAFGDPMLKEMYWRNMSSDNTVKATISLRNNTTERVLYDVKTKQYVDVLPNQGDAYWNGMERMLRQYSLSNMGKLILKGDTDEQIAAWLLSPAGKSLRDSLDSAWAVAKGADADSLGPRIGDSLANAKDFVADVRMGLEEITAGNKDVWTVMRSHAPSAAELKAMMKNMSNLSPVVGSTEQILGRSGVMDMWRKTTEKGFRNIGTKPEDAFVRGPFYNKAFTAERDKRLAVLYSQYATREEVPLKFVYAIQDASHNYALKATKDWLYTIDRRTKLGHYGEAMFPFISAAQNSVTALGRLSYRDPSVPAALALLWQAPTKVGWEDDRGNLLIPIPHDLIPDGVEDFFGIAGMKNATIRKSSLNVIFPETGAAFIPRPTPIVQAAASSLMVHGLFGAFGPEAPAPLVAVFGQESADKTWKYMKDYMFSEEGGLSSELFSYDKILPPIANKAIQYIQQDGSSQYGYQYALQARTQDLLWRAGERPDYPKPDEIMKRTNGMFILRMLGNAFAFTPPNYESPIQPLLDAQRAYDEAYGLEGPMKFSENFGNETMILSDLNSTRNVGGITSNPGTVRNIRKYDGLVRQLANVVGEDLDVMGLIVNEDMANSFYDPNASRWMLATKIPGTSRTWRESQSGGESMAESQRQAGWVEYIKFKGQLDALLQQRGLNTYSNKGAEDLNSYRKEFINNMINNPMYEGWAVDFQSTGSSKTYSAVKTLTAALNDDTFMADHADNRTWQIAAEYIDTRNRLIQMVQESGVTLENNVNQVLKDQWDEYRQSLIDRDYGWSGIANRYLNGDDNPTDVGSSFMTEGM